MYLDNSKWVQTGQLRNEESKADANRSEERRLVLLCCQHKDGQQQHECEEHLDEKASGYRGFFAEGGIHGEWSREETRHNCCSSNGSEKLRNDQQYDFQPSKRSDEAHGDRDLDLVNVSFLFNKL